MWCFTYVCHQVTTHLALTDWSYHKGGHSIHPNIEEFHWCWDNLTAITQSSCTNRWCQKPNVCKQMCDLVLYWTIYLKGHLGSKVSGTFTPLIYEHLLIRSEVWIFFLVPIRSEVWIFSLVPIRSEVWIFFLVPIRSEVWIFYIGTYNEWSLNFLLGTYKEWSLNFLLGTYKEKSLNFLMHNNCNRNYVVYVFLYTMRIQFKLVYL